MDIPDDILCNILVRLPGKPLLRFRCVSTRWNALISDPHFMRSRSRRIILLPHLRPLASLDNNLPVPQLSVRISSPLEQHHDREIPFVTVIGTHNGIAFLVLTHLDKGDHIYLYNPLTGAYKLLMVMDPPPVDENPNALGLAYGATAEDLMIVSLRFTDHQNHRQLICDVFNLKTRSWSKSSLHLNRRFSFWIYVGRFVNGYLYWVTIASPFKILALDVKEMVVMELELPSSCDINGICLLGSLNGSLCVINKIDTVVDVWVMKEQAAWLKAFSFSFRLDGWGFYPMLILGNGNILFSNGSDQLFIYDKAKDSYKSVDDMASHNDIERIENITDINRIIYPVEYTESLVSPSDIYSWRVVNT